MIMSEPKRKITTICPTNKNDTSMTSSITPKTKIVPKPLSHSILPTPKEKNRSQEIITFAKKILTIGEEVGMKMSSRGWGYFLEGENEITKDQIDVVEKLINECRKKGLIPVDFIAQEEGRRFAGIEIPERHSVIEYMKNYLNYVTHCANWYTPDWWEGEKYYIQMIVEKIDLKNLFQPICEQYHIPIASSKGWSSIHQRAEYARRYKQAEKKGLIGVLLYCGDHDPDGLRISKNLMNNLLDIERISWNDGTRGYNPENLIIKRFGLNYDFIDENNLVWIDNLVTGSGKSLASPRHKNHKMFYVQNYLSSYGERKVEANALLKNREAGESLCRNSIEDMLGATVLSRFQEKRDRIVEEAAIFRKESGIEQMIEDAIQSIDEYEYNNEIY